MTTNGETERDRLIQQLVDICRRISQLDEGPAETPACEQSPSIEGNLLRTLIDTLPDAIYFKDAESRFIAANEAVAHMMGADNPADVIGLTDFDFYPQELAARYYADERRIVRLGQAIVGQEEPAQDATGRARWLSTTKVPIRDGSGNILGIVGIGRDITDKKRAEQELEEYRHRLEEMVADRTEDLAQLNDMLALEVGERRQTEDSLRHYAERLKTLQEIDQTILGLQSPETIAHAALVRLQRLIPFSNGAAWELESGENALRRLAVHEDKPRGDDTDASSTLTPVSLKLSQVDQGYLRDAFFVPDLAESPRQTAIETILAEEGHQCYLSVPIVSREEAAGMLLLCADQPHSFRNEHIEIANQVATSLAIAIHQARLHARTRGEAETRDFLLEEVNRLVKNNLTAVISLLQAELQKADKPSRPYYQRIIGNLAGRLQGMTTVHRMLTAYSWAPLPLTELVSRIARVAVQASAGVRDVEITVNPSQITVNPDQALYLALAVNELAANTSKHAMPADEAPRLQVLLSDDQEMVTLEFRDNGPGYPEETIHGVHKAGLQVVKDVVRRDLGGQIEFNNDGGAVTTIRFRPRR